MVDGSSSIGVTFNGEIYGYKSIKKELIDYPFRTESDTEVVLALYREFGSGMMPHLPGMFAFALWDDDRKSLFCARDRFGEKPLFFAFGRNGEFILASEIKALLASGLIEPVLSRRAITHYLQKLYVHPHETVYENINTLPPAHMLEYTGGRLTVTRYWSLPTPREAIEFGEAVERFRELLHQSVERQLVADVPVGVFLSGGLDSSSIVATATKIQPGIKSFSFGFDGVESELPFAKAVAQRHDTHHIELTEHGVNVAELLLRMQEVYDEPFADSSNIPTYLIAKRARESLKVILTGDGGDELLGGYSGWYRPLAVMDREREASWWKQCVLGPFFSLAVRSRLEIFQDLHYLAKGLHFARNYKSIPEAHESAKKYFTEHELAELGLRSWKHLSRNHEPPPSDTLDSAFRMDLEDYMPGDILVKIDRASMSHGLELRAPFLDIDFASFCISLPANLKVTTRADKIIIREALSSVWPPAIKNRRKQGFAAPILTWFKKEELQRLKHQYLGDSDRKIFQLISFEKSRPFVDQDGYKTWPLLVLALWMETHEFSYGSRE